MGREMWASELPWAMTLPRVQARSRTQAARESPKPELGCPCNHGRSEAFTLSVSQTRQPPPTYPGQGPFWGIWKEFVVW